LNTKAFFSEERKEEGKKKERRRNNEKKGREKGETRKRTEKTGDSSPSRLLPEEWVWPEDVLLLIRDHGRAMRIQSAVRRRQQRHSLLPVWPHLLSHLSSVCSPSSLSVLQSNPLVRREWRTEPESWLLCSEEEVDEIVREVKRGVWSLI